MAFTPRSEATRRAILAAARQAFLDRGYDGTTVRAVAAAAGVDASMVMRYHGSKDGLFAAAVDVDLDLPDLTAIPRDRIGLGVARHFVDLWEGDRLADSIVLLLRSAPTHEAAAERLRAVFADQVRPRVESLCGTGPDTTTRAGLLVAQLVGVALTRYVVRIRPVVDLTPDRLVAALAPVLQHYLTGDLGAAVPA